MYLPDSATKEDDNLAPFLIYRNNDPAIGSSSDNNDPSNPHSNGEDGGEEEEEGDKGEQPNMKETWTKLGEAVYDLVWSLVDPWVFLGMGYEGSLVLNHVPSKETYRILLEFGGQGAFLLSSVFVWFDRNR